MLDLFRQFFWACNFYRLVHPAGGYFGSQSANLFFDFTVFGNRTGSFPDLFFGQIAIAGNNSHCVDSHSSFHFFDKKGFDLQWQRLSNMAQPPWHHLGLGALKSMVELPSW